MDDLQHGALETAGIGFGAFLVVAAINELGLKKRILDDLVSRVLIVQESSRLGIEVSDEELRETIEAIPSFQFGGRFDPRTYERYLRSSRMSAEEFERIPRENLVFTKVVNLVRLNAGKVFGG